MLGVGGKARFPAADPLRPAYSPAPSSSAKNRLTVADRFAKLRFTKITKEKESAKCETASANHMRPGECSSAGTPEERVRHKL